MTAPGSPSEKGWSKIDDPYYFGPNRIWVAAERNTLKQCTIWQNDTGKGKQPSTSDDDSSDNTDSNTDSGVDSSIPSDESPLPKKKAIQRL